jgi:hypothetical protein
MNLDTHLIAEQESLIRQRDLLLVDASVFANQRKNGDAKSRCADGKESTRLKKEAQEKSEEIDQIAVAVDMLRYIVPSLNRRQEIAHYHYSNWLEVEEKGVYAAILSRKLGGDGYVNAITYNAEVLAFLQNVHAICDSFPYLLNLYLRTCDFESRSIGWNDKTMDAFRGASKNSSEKELLKKLENFFTNAAFLTLQKIVNCAKHKHIIPIYFNGTKAVFGKLDGESGLSDLGVKDVMIDVHDSLLPLVFEMLQLALVDDTTGLAG